MWLKSNLEWEVSFISFISFSSFIVFSTIGESNWLNIFSSGAKLKGQSFSCCGSCRSNMVGETVFKEVPIGMSIWGSIIISVILAIDRVHCHKVARVLAISKEFKTKSWNESLATTWSNCCWHPDETLRSALEDSWICAGLVSFKRNFSNNTHRVNIFSSLSKKTTWHQITSCIESWIHGFDKETWHLKSTWEVSSCSVSNNLAPKAISFIQSGQRKILKWSSVLQKVILNFIFN